MASGAPDQGWIGLDSAGLLFLTVTSALFLCASVYAVGYLRRESAAAVTDYEEGLLFRNGPEAAFTACLLWFLATMSLVAVSRHLGLTWVAVEATTLASAPLIYYHRHHRSLEATWKYLLICSVGIALAMMGNFFVAIAGSAAGPSSGPARDGHLTLHWLLGHAGQLDPVWLKAAFILCLVGYGTKMGLAPMHTWLPDAHSEAPSMVSALLSGALLNCAFLALLRVHSVMAAAGLGDFSRSLLVLLGLVSMGLAAIFIIHQADFKRLLAYSSVEHMGLLAVGVGLGGAAGFASMLHAVNHSLAKAMLFLTAGNLLTVYQTKRSGDVRGVLGARPLLGAVWLAGFFAIAGSPPFGPFLSELGVLQGAIAGGRWVVAAVYLAALGTIFVAMARIVLSMVYGLPRGGGGPGEGAGVGELHGDLSAPASGQGPGTAVVSWTRQAPPLALGAAVLVLGVYLPPWLTRVLHQAADAVGAT